MKSLMHNAYRSIALTSHGVQISHSSEAVLMMLLSLAPPPFVLGCADPVGGGRLRTFLSRLQQPALSQFVHTVFS